jgi:SAM-dependent methyltransferase
MKPHWDDKAGSWDGHLPASELFDELLALVVEHARIEPRGVIVDLGAGTGFLTIPLAELVGDEGRVYAVDHSREMLSRLEARIPAGACVEVQSSDIRDYRPPELLDAVVTNYSLHHLSHRAKGRLIEEAASWLKPGGRIVVSDLMIPLTLRPGQSGPLLAKLRSIASRGPAGYWRIAKNGARWVSGRGEYPADVSFWKETLVGAGFQAVGGTRVGTESGVVWGTRQPTPNPVGRASRDDGR